MVTLPTAARDNTVAGATSVAGVAHGTIPDGPPASGVPAGGQAGSGQAGAGQGNWAHGDPCRGHGDSSEHGSRPVPSFWNFADNEHGDRNGGQHPFKPVRHHS